MEPLAIAAYTAIAGAATLGALVGILAGAIASAIRGSVVWIALAAAAAYLVQMVFFEFTRLEAAAAIGLPPMLLTLLTCWLVARFLQSRRQWRRHWAIAAAVACALIAGVADLMLFRLAVWAPSALALVAVMALTAVALFLRPGFDS